MNPLVFRLVTNMQDRIRFDELVWQMVENQVAPLSDADLQAMSPEEHRERTEKLGSVEFAHIPDDPDFFDWDPTTIYVDDVAEAQARFRLEFEAAIVGQVRDRLERELYQTDGGYATTLIIRPGGQQNGLEFGPAVIELKALDDDGNAVAYRYADDNRDEDWQVGTVEDAVAAWADAERE